MSIEINIVDKMINRHVINSLDLDQLINKSVNRLSFVDQRMNINLLISVDLLFAG